MALQWHSNGTPMALQWFSNGSPIVLQLFSNDTPINFAAFSIESSISHESAAPILLRSIAEGFIHVFSLYSLRRSPYSEVHSFVQHIN